MREDKTLYKEFLAGNEEAFEKIMDKYIEKLIYFINSFVKNIDVAEDLAQDVFVYILINKKDYYFKYSLKTYLFTIGKCRALNYIKKEKRIIPFEECHFDIQDEEIEETIYKKEKKQYLKNGIKKLKEPQSRVVYLADIEELSYKDICKILDMSLPKVKSLIHRGRKNLKNILLTEGAIFHE